MTKDHTHLSPRERTVLELMLRHPGISAHAISRKTGISLSTTQRIRTSFTRYKVIIQPTYLNAESLQGYNFVIIAKTTDHHKSYEEILSQLPRIIAYQPCFIDTEPAYYIMAAFAKYDMDSLDALLNLLRKHLHTDKLNVIRLKGMPINLQWSLDALLGALPDGNKDPEIDNETELEVPQ